MRALLLRVQQRLADIERRRGGGCDGSRQTAGDDVRLRVVVALSVQQVLAELVDDEVQALKRDVHGQLRSVAAVERDRPFLGVNSPETVDPVPVRTPKDLHPLLYH